MLAFLLTLGAVAAAQADCNACIQGTCRNQHPILQGFVVTDRLAYDHRSHILYLQLNDNLNTAIQLPYEIFGPTILNLHLINTINTKGMAVDAWTSDLYMAKTGVKTLYKYAPSMNTTDTIAIWNQSEYPAIRHYYIDTNSSELVIMAKTNDTSYFYFIRTDTYQTQRTLTLNYSISDFVIERNKLFFVSNNSLYKIDLETTVSLDNTTASQKLEDISSSPTPTLIVKKNQIVLYSDSYGTVFIGDATEKVIYVMHQETEPLEIFAAYDEGHVEDFIIDKNGDIIFRDADGSVKIWCRSSSADHDRCAVEAPHANFLIKRLNYEDNSNRGNLYLGRPQYRDGYRLPWGSA